MNEEKNIPKSLLCIQIDFFLLDPLLNNRIHARANEKSILNTRNVHFSDNPKH